MDAARPCAKSILRESDAKAWREHSHDELSAEFWLKRPHGMRALEAMSGVRNWKIRKRKKQKKAGLVLSGKARAQTPDPAQRSKTRSSDLIISRLKHSLM